MAKKNVVKLFGEGESAPGVPVPWRFGGIEHTLLVRAIPQSVRDRSERTVMSPVQTGKFNQQRVVQTAEQGRAITRLNAVYGLVDFGSEFNLEIDDKALRAEFAQVLGEEPAPGEPYEFKGKLTPEVKEVLFTRIPDLAAHVDNAGLKLAGVELQQEVELGKA